MLFRKNIEPRCTYCRYAAPGGTRHGDLPQKGHSGRRGSLPPVPL